MHLTLGHVLRCVVRVEEQVRNSIQILVVAGTWRDRLDPDLSPPFENADIGALISLRVR